MRACYIHLGGGAVERTSLLTSLDAAGVNGCILLSLPSESFADDTGLSAGDRLAQLGRWCEGEPRMFIDITPGTPPIYREDLVRRECSIGYGIMGSLLWGGDCFAPGYDPVYVRQ